MPFVALKMLIGSHVKCLVLIFGIIFSTFLISQQIDILFNLLSRITSQIEEIQEANIWVMDPQVEYIDENRPLPERDLYRVRSVEGVKWAVPFYKGLSVGRTIGGRMKQVIVLGVDDNSLVGQPRKMIYGKWEDIKQPNALIMDYSGWIFLWPNEPFEYGREIELNDQRMIIVGLCEAAPPFMTYPLVYARYSVAVRLSPQGRNSMSFVLAKPQEGYTTAQVVSNIANQTKLQVLDKEAFKKRSLAYYLQKTGFIINFSITVFLGFFVGVVVVALTFYLFILENIQLFGVLKAIGVSNRQILQMVLTQAFFVAFVGFCIGIGLIAVFFKFMENTENLRGFVLYWQVVLIAFFSIGIIITLSSIFSIRALRRLDPAEVFKQR